MKVLLLLAVACLCIGTASAAWFDGFEGYPNGQNLFGVGGWNGWDNNAGATAYVTQAQAFAGIQSVDINGPSDLVQQFSGYTSGLHVFRTWQYIPSIMVGNTYVIMLDQYTPVSGPDHWTVQVWFDAVKGLVHDDMSGKELPLITDKWVPIVINIDLDNDRKEFYYGGQLLAAESWTRNAENGNLEGKLNIGCLDLYANSATSAYYDNVGLDLIPEPGLVSLVGLGALLLLRKRR